MCSYLIIYLTNNLIQVVVEQAGIVEHYLIQYVSLCGNLVFFMILRTLCVSWNDTNSYFVIIQQIIETATVVINNYVVRYAIVSRY